MSIKQTIPIPKTKPQKNKILKDKVYISNTELHSIKKDQYPTLRRKVIIMVIADAFQHYVALNPVTHCNDYYAYETLYEH